MKKIIYFLQSLIIYLFFLISKLIGLKLSRLVFSFIKSIQKKRSILGRFFCIWNLGNVISYDGQSEQNTNE